MLRVIDRNKESGLEVIKHSSHVGQLLGYFIGTLSPQPSVKKIATASTLRMAREIAGITIKPPIKETVSEAVHAANQASARMKKPKRG